MKFLQWCVLFLLAFAYTSAEFFCDTDQVPIACDNDDATVEQKRVVVKLSRGKYDLKATIKCKGSAAARVCLGPNEEDDDTIGVMIAVEPSDESDNSSTCFSMFYLGGKAEKYKSTCKGKGFRFEQKLVIGRHD